VLHSRASGDPASAGLEAHTAPQVDGVVAQAVAGCHTEGHAPTGVGTEAADLVLAAVAHAGDKRAVTTAELPLGGFLSAAANGGDGGVIATGAGDSALRIDVQFLCRVDETLGS